MAPPLDFDVLKEIWAKYELADHSAILKIKVVLTVVTKTPPPAGSPPGAQGYSIDAQNVTVVLTNERGLPDTRQYSPAEVSAAITRADLRFSTISQDWNEYVVDDGTRIKIQPILLSVSKTSLFNNKGTPVYTNNINLNVQIKPPGSQLPSLTS